MKQQNLIQIIKSSFNKRLIKFPYAFVTVQITFSFYKIYYK